MSRDVTPYPKQGPRPKAKRKPLPYRSVRRLSEAEARDAVRAEVLERDRWTCVAPGRGLPGLCASPHPGRPALEVHEVEARGTHPGSHLRHEVCVTLCQSHHDAVTSPHGADRIIAEMAGLLVRNSTAVRPHVRDAS